MLAVPSQTEAAQNLCQSRYICFIVVYGILNIRCALNISTFTPKKIPKMMLFTFGIF
ncbi:hypothetical protein CZ794_11890 [Psychrobacter sp. JB385]|nr:hypothetical protein CZ794_11890 [Psychrobacter sp. JB385]